MTVNLICNHNVATIAASEDIADAAVRMRDEHVGNLIVVERHDAYELAAIADDRRAAHAAAAHLA